MPHLHVCFGLLLLFASSMFAQQLSILYFDNTNCNGGAATNYVGLVTLAQADCTGFNSGNCTQLGTQSQFTVCNASTYSPPPNSGNLTEGCESGPYSYYYFQENACVSGLTSQKGVVQGSGLGVDVIPYDTPDCTGAVSTNSLRSYSYVATQTCTTTRTLSNGTILTGLTGYQFSLPTNPVPTDPPTPAPTDLVTSAPTVSIFDTNQLIAVAASLPSLFNSPGEFSVTSVTILQNVSATDDGLINFVVVLEGATTLDQACITLIAKMLDNVPILEDSPCNENCMTCSIVADLPNTVQIQINDNYNSVASHVASLALFCIALCLMFV